VKKLKIGMIGAWNSSSGASIHAELIGRSWIETGHALHVFTFYPYSYHGASITSENEDYVSSCFTTSRHDPIKFDPRPILMADFDFFVVQDHGMIPNDPLGKIFHWIKDRAKTVAVIHDGRLSEDPSFYQFEWDAIIAFDERYEAFLKNGYPNDRIVKIPYPSFSLRRGNKEKAREKLNLPQDKKIALMFGPAANYAEGIVDPFVKTVKNMNAMLLVLTKHPTGLKIFGALEEKYLDVLKLRREAPFTDRLYDYLHASDVLIFQKESKPHVVVSSTIHQCLGSGCPVLAFRSNFSDYFGDEVTKYSNYDEFSEKLLDLLNQGPIYQKSQKALVGFLKNYDGPAIAKRYIDLFNKL
jgi:glycosyltransferase involved in cell wall biosynthesis